MSIAFLPSNRPALVHTLAQTKKVFKAVLLGPPGSFKWELGEKIGKTFKLTHVSIRERINANIQKDSKFGQLAKTCIEKGTMVPPKIMMKFITKEILEAELAGHSWLISGFPVTETEANSFWSHIKLHMAIHVHFPEDVCVQNLLKRHQKGKAPEDVTKKALMEIMKLLENYKKISKPMLNFYKDHNVLHSHYSNDMPSMWGKIQKSLDNHVTVFNNEDAL